MLVSIITPSYNQVKYLPDLITSVKSQTYRPIEHIICDGGSQDGTIDLLAAYNRDSEDIRVVWKSEADRGQAHAINKAFDLSSGEIIGWINSDDVYFHKAVVQRVVEAFENHPEVDVIHGDVAKISADNLIGLIWCIPDFNFAQMVLNGKISQPTVFFRRKVLEENLLREDVLCLDYEFWLRLGNRYSFLHINDVLAGDRDQPNRISRVKTVELVNSHKAVKEEYLATISKAQKNWYGLINFPQRIVYRLIGLFRLFHIKQHQQNMAFNAQMDKTSSMIRRQLFSRIEDLFHDKD
jgi:glycosyltransferase involved in cell wall biosynthesis